MVHYDRHVQTRVCDKTGNLYIYIYRYLYIYRRKKNKEVTVGSRCCSSFLVTRCVFFCSANISRNVWMLIESSTVHVSCSYTQMWRHIICRCIWLTPRHFSSNSLICKDALSKDAFSSVESKMESRLGNSWVLGCIVINGDTEMVGVATKILSEPDGGVDKLILDLILRDFSLSLLKVFQLICRLLNCRYVLRSATQ